MALNTEQKNKILVHLCYQPTNIVEGHRFFLSRVRDRLINLTDEICDLVDGQIEKLDTAEECLEKAVKCLKVSKVADVVMNKDHIENSRREYRRLQKKLSCTLDLPICKARGSSGVNIVV